ncbi:hypothetical protein F4780DRAFT_744769, partial [Xylariomycetidae sp. FL0641]
MAEQRELEDLRDKYPDERMQNFYLHHQWPTVFSSHSLGFLAEEQRVKSMHGLDVMLIVTRHVLSYLPLRTRRTWDGVKNPILELVWKDLQPSRAAEQSRLRYEAMKTLAFDSNIKLSEYDPSYLQLAESQMMWDTLLQLDEVLLNFPNPMICYEDVEDAPLTQIRYGDLSRLARGGCVRWDPSQTTIVKAIGNKFIVGHDDQGIQIWWSSNDPLIIRVHVRIPDGFNQLGFDDVRTILIDDARLKKNQEGKLYMQKEVGDTQRHNLIAVVRLRKDGSTEHEYVRLYTTDGAVVIPFETQPHCQWNGWSFGEPGREYMLYYRRCTAPPQYARERLSVQSSRLWMEAMERDLAPVRSPP